MTVVPGAAPHILSLVCDTCGQAVDGIESTARHWPVVWALISRQGWGGSPLAIGPHHCPDCFSGADLSPERRPRGGDEPWDVVLTNHPQACVVRLQGQLDILYAHELTEVLRDAAARHRNTVLDMRDVRLLDSTGMGQLVQARQAAAERAGSLCLVAPSPFIMNVLETMRLAPKFQIFPDTRAALDWLARGAR